MGNEEGFLFSMVFFSYGGTTSSLPRVSRQSRLSANKGDNEMIPGKCTDVVSRNPRLNVAPIGPERSAQFCLNFSGAMPFSTTLHAYV